MKKILPIFICFTASHLMLFLHVHRLTKPILPEPAIKLLYPDIMYPLIISPKERSLHTIIHLAAKKYALSPLLIEAVIKTESDFNMWAERYEPHVKASSVGLMQVMTFNATKSPCNLTHHSELFIPSQNVDCGSALLKEALNSTKSLQDALIVYNGGIGCLTSKKCRPQGTAHALKVMKVLSKSIIRNSL